MPGLALVVAEAGNAVRTLARWMMACGNTLVVPLVSLVGDALLASKYPHMDQDHDAGAR